MKGITLSLYAPDYKTPLNALAGLRSVTLVGTVTPKGDLTPIPGAPAEPSELAPAVVIVHRPGNLGSFLRLLEEPKGHRMFGGAYAASSDSRFREALGFYGAVAVHDRYEN